MASRSNFLCFLTSAMLLTCSGTQALRPLRVPSQIITKLNEAPHNGSAVPGVSPVMYHNNPGNDLFKIESLDMHPNPCVLESYCTVIIHGDFTTSLTNETPHVSFNVTSHLPHGRTGLVPGEDAFCNWVDIIQDGNDDDAYTQTHNQALAQNHANHSPPDLLTSPSNPVLHRQKRKDRLSCPPKKGKALISSTILLLGGYVPEANFTVKVKATEEGREGKEGRTIFDLWTEFELKSKDDAVMKLGGSGHGGG